MTATTLLASALLAASCELEPAMWADVPDVAPLRVGDTYYMVSTTMHCNPGIPVMSSKDLVNWKTVGYCYDTIEDRPEDRLEDGKNDYMYGTWASSIRYNAADGYFYVSSFNQRARHTYLFRAKDPAGPWERHVYTDRLVYDHSLWIEDGKFYLFGSAGGKVYLHRIKDDLSGIEHGEKLVCPDIRNNLRGGLAEGSQVFKRGDWYYLVNICWPGGKCRLVNVHRAKSIEGPFVEAHVAFEREGIAQGSFVERPDGSWVAVLFGDRGGVGRIPFMLETEWVDDWPVVQPREVRDAQGRANLGVPGCVASDEFDGEKLKLEWQWNHNPDPAFWSLTERPGWLRLKSHKAQNLLQARNTLTQRTFGPTSEAVTKIDASAMQVGDVAGLALFQHHYGYMGVEKTEKGLDLVLVQPNIPAANRHTGRPLKDVASREVARRPFPGDAKSVYIKAVCDFRPCGETRDFRGIPESEDAGKFFFSTDGKSWTPIGDAMYLPYTIPHFMGYRFALFGAADFDFFRVGPASEGYGLKSDGTNPLVKHRFTADPAGYVDGEWLYVFTGHDDPAARGYRMLDWCVARTKDMKNWEDFGPVLDCAKVFPWARADKAWASQVVKRDGKWYWYVAISDKGGAGRQSGDCIGVAVADDFRGPWKDPLGRGIVYGAGYIDPTVMIDDDGSAWLFWGNCWGTPGCWYAKLKDSMTEVDPAGLVEDGRQAEGQPKGVMCVPGLMEESAFGKPLKKKAGAGARKPIDTNFEEAPWIYKLGDTYYLEYAAGGVPENWSYSTAKSIHGPWTFRGKIMENAGGTGTIHGGSVFFKGEWYMLYHDGHLPGGADCRRSACIERYVRNPDGTIPFIQPTKSGVSVSPRPR